MIDFLKIATRRTKSGVTEIYPKFIIRNPSRDLMIRGKDFYAVWVEERKEWSQNEQDVIDLIDHELDLYAKENRENYEGGIRVLHMWDSESGSIDQWHKYCQKQMRDCFHSLNEKLIFSNTEKCREDYSSHSLPYPLQEGTTECWDKLLGTLYSEEERHKIEWAVGSIVSGDSRKLQKFMVFYGEPGSGKGTILEIIQSMFEGYTTTFNAKALGQSGSNFAMEAFKNNPLVAFQFDGNLSKIEDNSRLNTLVSHEEMTVNEKFKGIYSNRFKCFLFLGTNRPVQITDAKSGLLRRLIDVTPSGQKIPRREYDRLCEQVKFELGAIAWKCKQIYTDDPHAYDDYIPVNMMGASNDFFNFITYPEVWDLFNINDEITLKEAWRQYKEYCEMAKVQYPFNLRVFKEELKNYFKEFHDREQSADGSRVRNLYRVFLKEKFTNSEKAKPKTETRSDWLSLTEQKTSILDQELAECPAQYASEDDKPLKRWEGLTTRLKDLDPTRTHFVKVPEKHIVIDFDLRNEKGEKDLKKNLEAAEKWPKTYAETSKSGKGLHLHYIYSGDPKELSRIFQEHIEIKVFTGNASLRRKLYLCNALAIASIATGLPKREVKKKADMLDMTNEQKVKGLKTLIENNLAKQYHAATKPSIDMIRAVLDEAYEDSSMSYDLRYMKNTVLNFAANSTHNADYCIKQVGKMHFMSKDIEAEDYNQTFLQKEKPIVFYDTEVFPNLFLLSWKLKGEKNPVIHWFNPSPAQIEDFVNAYRLIDFNGRRYDRHILYGRMMGYSNLQIYTLSKRLINTEKGKKNDFFFREAYNLGYTDVYDFASAGNKKSLKKLEIEMGIHHQELGFDWNEPVDEKKWMLVASYCENDVKATEAAFEYLKTDWTARQLLADLAGMTVNDTTNSLTTRIIFDRVHKPQEEFCYRDLSLPVKELRAEVKAFLLNACPEMMSELHGEEESLLPYFPSYCYEKGVSTYRGEEVGEGGYVYAEPGTHCNVALLDVASMHPHSIIAECLFGPRFTPVFKQIVDGRVYIKHEAWDECDKILDGKLKPFIAKVKAGEMSSKDLANALKTAINSVYGLTSAAFENAFRDPRNKDNIVAKRGALFMVDLKEMVQKEGFTVAHIKTDSIKIPNATNDIIKKVMAFGRRYGYSFEHEATYSKMCLVNDAVYIARYASAEDCDKLYGYAPGDNKKKGGEWTATGKQFAVPYVFKTLFSKEDITFEDMCETFSVSGALVLDMNEDLPDVSDKEKELAKLLKEYGLTADDWLDFKAGDTKDRLSIDQERRLRTLESEIAKGHDYHFVGRVGEFTPVKPGAGGGLLMRNADGKYSAATGTKGWRWMESEMVRQLHRESDIDREYYLKQCDDAVETIRKYCDEYEWFVQ